MSRGDLWGSDEGASVSMLFLLISFLKRTRSERRDDLRDHSSRSSDGIECPRRVQGAHLLRSV